MQKYFFAYFSAYCYSTAQKIRSATTKSLVGLFSTLADLFFPFTCFGCGKANTWLCPHCQARIPALHNQRCFLCHSNTTRYGEACYQCQSSQTSQSQSSQSPSSHDVHPLDAVFSATCYHLPVVKKMIHTYKYQFVESLAIPLGTLFAKSLESSTLPLPHVLVPVPLHPKRLRYRGFNQSALLANLITQHVAALSGIPVTEVLSRVRYTKPQQKTHSKDERASNLTDAFQIVPGFEIQNKTAWLVDDVATTHSTLTECAKILKEAGAKKVYAVVLAQD